MPYCPVCSYWSIRVRGWTKFVLVASLVVFAFPKLACSQQASPLKLASRKSPEPLLRLENKASTSLPSYVDTIWEANARTLPAQTTLDAASKMTFRSAHGMEWLESSPEAFIADCLVSDVVPGRRTFVYVHGNWTTEEEARQRGLLIYRKLAQLSAAPIQFIIYSWDSARESRLAFDVRQKHQRLSADAYYLTQVLRFIPESTPLGMISFSFGTGVTCGALHLESGGALAGVKLIQPKFRSKLNVAFLAAAFDRDDLEPSRQYDRALEQIDHLVNLYNSLDPALKRFHLLAPKSHPVAAGFSGISANQDSSARPELFQADCRNLVGRSHAEMAYLLQCRIFDEALPILLED